MPDLLYPASPDLDKALITRMTSEYRTQIIINLFSIILFFLLFLGMIAGAAYLVYLTWHFPLRDDFSKYEGLAKIGAIAMAVMLFLFLLKFLFKSHKYDNPANIEIFEKDHPELFAFIRKLSKEVGAPFPKKIFVNHEINASVFYNSTILSLFLPVKKNLLIGLGLVNSVNLSEFKAIMAHEFGHFAQSSMRLGSYVYMANRIIHDMVYERDRWDEYLERWKSMDWRVAIFAWLLMPVIWVVRMFMSILYRGLNALHSALSRQMEYNADLVAVSVTGSDQIINSLYKMSMTSQSYDYTMNKLTHARDHNMLSEDLFYNHRTSHKELKNKNPEFAALDLSEKFKDGAGKQLLFETDDDSSTISMYASHPSNYKRERNAKSLYRPGTTDERSPWLLFGDAEGLAQVVTKNLYTLSLGEIKKEFMSKEKVQAFINDEINDQALPERYLGYFDKHNFNVPTTEELETDREILTANELSEALEQLWSDSFRERMKLANSKFDKLNEVVAFLQNPPKKGTIEVAGKVFKAKEAMQAYHAINKQLESESEWFMRHDLKVYDLYLQASQLVRPGDKELHNRYEFMRVLLDVSIQTSAMTESIQLEAQEFSNLPQPTEGDVMITAQKFGSTRKQFEALIADVADVTIPPLKNVEVLENLGKFLLPKPAVFVATNELNFERVQNLLYQMADVTSRADRLLEKNLSGLVSLQEELENELSGKT